VLGGEAIVRAARVFFEDQRRSGELHLGSGRTTGATRADGKPAVRKAGRRSRRKNELVVRATLETELRHCSRGRSPRAAMLEGERDTRGSEHASVLSGR